MTPLFRIEINAHSAEQLAEALSVFNATLNRDGFSCDVATDPEGLSASVGVTNDPPTKTRTRAKKEAAPAKAAPAPTEEPTEQVKEPEADADAEAGDNKAVTVENPVGELSPKAAREDGIKRLQNYFAKNPNNMSAISELQAKYGVKMFSEVTDEKAHDFLADAKLIEAGAIPA